MNYLILINKIRQKLLKINNKKSFYYNFLKNNSYVLTLKIDLK